jgi:simple sugar transport system permease protein
MITTGPAPQTAVDRDLPARGGRLPRPLGVLARGMGPVLLALAAGGVLLLALGRNPLVFYGDIYSGGLLQSAWQDSVMRMAPLLLIAAGLILIFRANIWNLGYDGQFLLASAMVAGLGPPLARGLPVPLLLLVLFVVAALSGGVWTLLPAVLKARYAVNEIITTLMMSFIGINLANMLIKGPFQDFSSNVPQTGVLPLTAMLPSLPGTRIHGGIVFALAAVLVVHYLLTRTSFGLRLEVLGANQRTAVHVGVRVPRLIIAAFVASGALVGLAAAVEILGVWGYVRADWNPAFGDAVIPFVFLARLNALAVIPLIAFYAVLSIGGEYATQQAGLPADFLLVLIGLILLFMTITEYIGRRADTGASYLPAGLLQALGRRGQDA